MPDLFAIRAGKTGTIVASLTICVVGITMYSSSNIPVVRGASQNRTVIHGVCVAQIHGRNGMPGMALTQQPKGGGKKEDVDCLARLPHFPLSGVAYPVPTYQLH